MLKPEDVFSRLDLTFLDPDAQRGEIRRLLDEAARCGAAAACLPPCYVEDAKRYAVRSLKIATVTGYPNGFETSASKAFMAADAVKKGADEIEMVINRAWTKDGKLSDVEAEVAMVKAACGESLLKVNIGSDEMAEEDLLRMYRLLSEAGADCIVVPYNPGCPDASYSALRLLRQSGEDELLVKVEGDGRLLPYDALIECGADRIGIGWSRSANLHNHTV